MRRGSTKSRKFELVYATSEHSPTRVCFKPKTLPKVYVALNERSRKLYEQHLNISLPNLEHRCLPNIVSAELAKVIENSYRMVNIALVSEFADFASQIGADLVGILESIRARPTHSNIRFAGQAPGGYCLTKDPQFLFESMRVQGFDTDLNMITAAIEKSETMNRVVTDFLKAHLNKSWGPFLAFLTAVLRLKRKLGFRTSNYALRRGYELMVDPFVDVDEVADSFK